MPPTRKFPGRQSHAYLLLQLIAICGELPMPLIKRIVGDNRYHEKVITRLKTNRLILSVHKNALSGYRLTKAAKSQLLADNPSRFTFYLTGPVDTNQIRSEYRRRLRLHCAAEVAAMMYLCDVVQFLDEKPDVFYPEEEWPPEAPGISDAAFYGAREIKNMGINSKGVRNARAIGILLTPEIPYVVYNFLDALSRIDYEPEMTLKALLNTELCAKRLSRQYAVDSLRGLLIGPDMGLAAKLLGEAEKGKRLFFFRGGYPCFHFIPGTREGEVLLRLLCQPDIQAALDDLLSVNLLPRRGSFVADSNAMDKDGRPVLFGYACDLMQLLRFKRALDLHDLTGTLCCFDFQEDVMKSFFGERVTVESIDLGKFERRFF